ncbi:MAG: iron-containing alcohol dehydrogenase [Rhodospirillales bacterium]|nr:iron-containing alcohol dehydrogenase [Rhodospirillales bacterium]
MIAPFSFDAPAPITFGEGRLGLIAKDVKRLIGGPSPVLLVADPFLVSSGLCVQAEAPLTDAGYDVMVYSEIRSDTLASSIDAIVALARESGAKCIVAMGGGSTMDASKLAAALAVDGARAESYALGAERLPRQGLPKIAVPTTSGTGSEVTRTSVFSTETKKLWVFGRELAFDLALLDPTVTAGMPASLTAATGIDASVHAIEAATNRKRNPISTAMALSAVRSLRTWLATAIEEPENITARGHVQIAACIAGIAFDVTGVGVAHAIGHAIGENSGVHHGRAVGLALNATMQDAANVVPEAYAGIAAALGADVAGLTDEDAAAKASAAYDAWLREVGLKLSLDDHGLSVSDAGRITDLCFAPQNKIILAADSVDYTPESLEIAVGRMLAAS